MNSHTPKHTEPHTHDDLYQEDRPRTREERRREALEMIREDWERLNDDDYGDNQIHDGGAA